MRRPNCGPVSDLDQLTVHLKSLDGNWLGDSAEKQVEVWYPHGHETSGLPLLVCLASYLNSGPSLTGWRNFGESIPERLDRLFESGELAPCVVAFVDSYNRLGGTQFVNSSVIGNWSSALADDLVPAIEEKYGCGGEGRRGLFGHSSGGYGALYNLAKRPDVWAAAGSHAGDCGFDFVYRGELPKALRVLGAYEFNAQAFLDAFWSQEKPKGEQISALMMLAMAASYDPVEGEGAPLEVRLPVTHDTCEFVQEHWQKWLSFDPLTFVPDAMDAFKQAKAVYVDCGRQDEYNILYGTRRIVRLMETNNVNGRFEEFDGGHGTIGPRYEVSLPWLVDALSN